MLWLSNYRCRDYIARLCQAAQTIISLPGPHCRVMVGQSVHETPQALTWDGKYLWMSSRDLGTLLKIDARVRGRSSEEFDPPGVIWAGVSTNNGLRFTIGKGLNDDRYIYSFSPNEGFKEVVCMSGLRRV